jgi:hypothetical protein
MVRRAIRWTRLLRITQRYATPANSPRQGQKATPETAADKKSRLLSGGSCRLSGCRAPVHITPESGASKKLTADAPFNPFELFL